MGDFLREAETNMILYSVNCNSSITNYEWSIITIHKSYEGAKKMLDNCIKNWKESPYGEDFSKYKIVEINTDIDSDIIYDYEEV